MARRLRSAGGTGAGAPSAPTARTPASLRATDRKTARPGPAAAKRRAPSRPLGRPPASDGDERRRLIVEAARRQFGRDGYVATTNRQIADEAGITTGAIYHYFDSKMDLYLAAFEDVDRRILERYRAQVLDPPATFQARIETLLMASSALNEEDESLAGFIALAGFECQRSPALRTTWRAHDRRMVDFIEELMDLGEASGGLTSAAQRDALLAALRVITLGMTWYSVRVHDPAEHRRATEALISLLRGDLVKRGRRRLTAASR